MPTETQRQEYLKIISRPDSLIKLAKLEFLNPDGSVAFAVDNNYRKSYGGGAANGSRAFLQSGSLSVSLQNGKRRQASITFENLDGAFDYNVNHLWFGEQVRLSMGIRLSDGYEYYQPQGVFYIDSPSLEWRPNSRQANYTLTDKWAYLDGSLFGKLRDTYSIPNGSNIFVAMQAILQISKYSLSPTKDIMQMIDPIAPLFTDYFNNRTTVSNGQVFTNNTVPYDIITEYGQSYADALLELNSLIAGWIGYDNTGRLTVLPSENDIADQTKPVLWDFAANSKTFLGLSETSNIGDVYNQYVVIGEALDSDVAPIGIATNNDAASDTSVGRIGLKVNTESASGYYTKEQCASLAAFKLKRATVLKKSVTVSSTQMFHLQENNLITVQRSDKQGSPIERHLIQSYTIPIGQTGEMSITATSVTDYPNVTIEETNFSGVIT